MQTKKIITFLLAAVGLLVVPLFAQQFGNGPVRIIDLALLYVLLALGLNIVVGYAGLLDLGYVAFYAVGSYMFALLASPHLSENFEAFQAAFPTGLHSPIWLVSDEDDPPSHRRRGDDGQLEPDVAGLRPGDRRGPG